MAHIRVSFSTALFGLSFVICLLVALLFVDRSRQESEENNAAAAKAAPAATSASVENQLVQRAAMSSTPIEQPGTNQATTAGEGPRLVLNSTPALPSQPPSVELPLDPRMPAAASATPALTAAQRAALSPEALSKQMQGRLAIPPSIANSTAPPLAVPDGMPQTAGVAKPRPTARASARNSKMLPIMTNTNGVADAMKQLGPGSAFGAHGGFTPSQKDPALPFSQPGVVSTARLRDTLAANSNLDPVTLQPIEQPAQPVGPMTNAGAGWQPTSAAASAPAVPTITPNSNYTVRGTDRRVAAPALIGPADPLLPAADVTGPANVSTALPPPPTGVDPLAGLQSNQPAVPSPTPNYANGLGQEPIGNVSGNKWNLPPPPSLPQPAVRAEDAKGAAVDPSKSVLLPIDKADPNSGAANAVSPPAATVTEHGLSELPMDIAAKAGGVLDHAPAAKVNERSLSAGEAGRRAEALAAFDGRVLDEDHKQMLTRTAAENWTEMVALSEEAKRQGLFVKDDEVKTILVDHEPIKSGSWEAAMKKAGFTDAEVAAELRDLAVGEKLVKSKLAQTFPETKIREIYNKDPEKFKSARRLHVQEIYKARPKEGAATKQLEKELDKLQRQASSGTDFGFLAMQSSEAANKAGGGDMGWLDDKSKISEEMAQALLPLKPGQVSSVVADAQGYHIYKLVDVQEPAAGFEGARAQVERGLRNSVYRSTLDTAQANSKIELAHRQKKSRTVASRSPKADDGRSSSKTDDALQNVFPPKSSRTGTAANSADDKERVVETTNGRVTVRSNKGAKSPEVMAASRNATKSQADTGSAPAIAAINFAEPSEPKPHNVPGFGGPDNSSPGTLPSTPNPATASANNEQPRGPFSRLFGRFHAGNNNQTPQPQQQ